MLCIALEWDILNYNHKSDPEIVCALHELWSEIDALVLEREYKAPAPDWDINDILLEAAIQICNVAAYWRIEDKVQNLINLHEQDYDPNHHMPIILTLRAARERQLDFLIRGLHLLTSDLYDLENHEFFVKPEIILAGMISAILVYLNTVGYDVTATIEKNYKEDIERVLW